MIVENLHNPRIIVADGGMDGKTQIYDVELFEKIYAICQTKNAN